MSNVQTAPAATSKAPTVEVKAATGDVQSTTKSIPVGHIWLDALTDLPGKKLTDVLVATAREKVYDAGGNRINHQHAWLIEYTPAHRHFRVTWIPPGREKAEQSCFVHETRVKRWDPA